MTPFPNRALRIALSAATVAVGLSGAAFSAPFTVDRCSPRGADGVWRPQLTAEIGGEMIVFKIGENGLTTQIAYDRRRAVAYVRSRLGPNATSGRYTICGDSSFARERRGFN